jgi:hypothetical protein
MRRIVDKESSEKLSLSHSSTEVAVCKSHLSLLPKEESGRTARRLD